MQVFVIPKRLSAIRGLTDYADSRTLEHGARGVTKIRAVVNYQTAHIATHGNTHSSASQMSSNMTFRLAGTRAVETRWNANVSPASQNRLAPAIIEGAFGVEEARCQTIPCRHRNRDPIPSRR